MKILSIHYGHNSTVGLLEDGRVIFAQSEERLDRMKNSTGFPVKTLEHVYKNFGQDIDLAVFTQESLAGYQYLKDNNFKSVRYRDYFVNSRPRNWQFLIKYFAVKYFPGLIYNWLERKTKKASENLNQDEGLKNEALDYFSKQTQLSKEKIIFLNHHKAHAYSPLFNVDREKEALVFTLDAEGDDASATVSLYKNNDLIELSRTHKIHSLGHLYAEVTGFMGMKPNEDEFKVMGLAPYTKYDSQPIKDAYKKFADIFFINKELGFESAVPSGALRYYLFDKFQHTRFDHMAAGLQLFIEDIGTEWVRRWVEKTGVKDIALSGGVFMNVKLNQKISQLDIVENMLIMPSAGDESTVFGGMFFGYQQYCKEKNIEFAPHPFDGLYLGISQTNDQVGEYLENSIDKTKYDFEFHEEIEERIAELLAQNKVVARHAGKMEWGARSLGNRSIISNPASRDNVKVINEMIKNRDFWMPFAPSILEEDVKSYLKNPKNFYAPYMVLTMESTAEGQKRIPAALHQYDYTARPQAVRKSVNPEYYKVIEKFKEKTGTGCVLNTSFNLHGHPVAGTAKDAMEIMDNSGLEYLAINNYLVTKK